MRRAIVAVLSPACCSSSLPAPITAIANLLKNQAKTADILDGGRARGGRAALSHIDYRKFAAKKLHLFFYDPEILPTTRANPNHSHFAPANRLKNQARTADTLDGGAAQRPAVHTLPYRLSAVRGKELNLFCRDQREPPADPRESQTIHPWHRTLKPAQSQPGRGISRERTSSN